MTWTSSYYDVLIKRMRDTKINTDILISIYYTDGLTARVIMDRQQSQHTSTTSCSSKSV